MSEHSSDEGEETPKEVLKNETKTSHISIDNEVPHKLDSICNAQTIKESQDNDNLIAIALQKLPMDSKDNLIDIGTEKPPIESQDKDHIIHIDTERQPMETKDHIIDIVTAKQYMERKDNDHTLDIAIKKEPIEIGDKYCITDLTTEKHLMESKDKDYIMDIITIATEKQPEAMKGVRRNHWSFQTDKSPSRIVEYNDKEPPAPTQPATLRGVLTYEPGRNAFVRRVFLIVFIMLACTAIAVTIVYTTKPLRSLIRSNLGIAFMFACMFALFIVVFAFFYNYGKQPPYSYFLLFVTTILNSYICSFMTSIYAPHIILSAVLTTTACVLLCLGLSLTSIDFTKFLMVVIVAAFALFFAGMVAMFIGFVLKQNITIARLVLLILGSVVTCVMLIIEVQMILGGKSVEITEEDYALAAFLVYMSIIDLFLKCLGIHGIAGDG